MMRKKVMVPYLVYDMSTGRILRGGSCYKHSVASLAGNGEGVLLTTGDDLTQCVNLDTLSVVEKPPGFDPPETDYRTLRILNYPSLADQIGAILKGGDALAEMQAIVQAVKDRYPKHVR